jgi:hypothetical protein
MHTDIEPQCADQKFSMGEETDSIVVCEYCGRELKSKDKDDHIYAEHGITI